MQQQIADLREKLAQQAGGEMDARTRAELQQSADRLQQSGEQVREKMARAEEELQDAGAATADLRQKMEELGRLLNETLDNQLKEAIRQLREAAQKQQAQQADQSLEQAQQAQQELMDRLDQVLALLKQARMENELGELQKEIAALAQQQEQLIQQRQATSPRDTSELRRQADRQKNLGRETGKLDRKIEQAAERIAEEAPQIAEKLQQIGEQLQAQDPEGQMRQAASQLQAAQPQQAAGPQQQALQALQQAAAGVAGAQADVYQQARQELQQAAAEASRLALYLSGQQERLQSDTQELGRQGPQEMLQSKAQTERLERQQRAITQGAERMANKLYEAARKSPLMDPSLAAQAAAAAERSRQAGRDILGGATGDALGQQQDIMTAMNLLAQQLIGSSDNYQQASAQMAVQEYMRRLEQLAQQQRALNQQTQQAGGGQPMPGEGMRQGPGQRPGMQGMGGLADEQALIRQALQKMMQGQGQGSSLGNQLGGLPAEMDDVERDLRGEQVTRQTHRRQEDILHKMLDAQRSLYDKDRQERERRGRGPQALHKTRQPPRVAIAPPQAHPRAHRGPWAARDAAGL